MKFNKTILAVLVAGIAAPMAHAEVTMSGFLGIRIDGNDLDGDDGELRMVGDDSTLNVAASHELNSGLTGYANWRVDAALSNDGSATGDNIHLGVKGGFGDIRVGEVPDALEYGQVANDAKFDIGGEERGVSYTNSFGPATIGLNWSPVGTMNGDKAGGGSDKIAAGIKFGVGGFNVGVGFGDVNEETALSAGASFSVAGFSVAVAHKSFENQVETAAVEPMNAVVAVVDDPATPEDETVEEADAIQAADEILGDRETLSATVGYGIGNLTAKLTYEVETGDIDEDDTLIRLDLGYGLGGGMNISTRITQLTDEKIPAGEDADTDKDQLQYRIMLSKDF